MLRGAELIAIAFFNFLNSWQQTSCYKWLLCQLCAGADILPQKWCSQLHIDMYCKAWILCYPKNIFPPKLPTDLLACKTGKTVFPTPHPTSNTRVVEHSPPPSTLCWHFVSTLSRVTSLLTTRLSTPDVTALLHSTALVRHTPSVSNVLPSTCPWLMASSFGVTEVRLSPESSGNSVKSQCLSLKNLFWCCL